jgi:hypothetical protein
VTPLLDAALDYHHRGWTVFPIGGDKEPMYSWKQLRKERPSRLLLEDWFVRRAEGTTGLAVIHGAPSGMLAIRDWDMPEGYHRWAGDHPNLAADLPTAKTYRGYHVVFACKHEFQSRNGEFGDGEYRGDQLHYTILPPSAHPDGGNYTWLRPPSGPLRVLDPWEEELVPAGWRPKSGTYAIDKKNTYVPPPPRGVPAPVWSAIHCTQPHGPGQRNGCLFTLARKLRSLPGVTDPESCESWVHRWWTVALAVIRTREWSVTWADFCHAWESVERPTDRDLIARTMDRVGAAGGTPAEKLERLGREMASWSADGTFYLDVRRVAGWLGLKRMKAWRLLRKVFEVAKDGDPEKRIANTYRLRKRSG